MCLFDLVVVGDVVLEVGCFGCVFEEVVCGGDVGVCVVYVFIFWIEIVFGG